VSPTTSNSSNAFPCSLFTCTGSIAISLSLSLNRFYIVSRNMANMAQCDKCKVETSDSSPLLRCARSCSEQKNEPAVLVLVCQCDQGNFMRRGLEAVCVCKAIMCIARVKHKHTRRMISLVSEAPPPFRESRGGVLIVTLARCEGSPSWSSHHSPHSSSTSRVRAVAPTTLTSYPSTFLLFEQERLQLTPPCLNSSCFPAASAATMAATWTTLCCAARARRTACA
jgi:hypothetical protein